MQETLLLKQKEEDPLSERSRFLCPICGKHTVLWLLPTTMVKDLPIKCKRCGKEIVVNIEPIEES